MVFLLDTFTTSILSASSDCSFRATQEGKHGRVLSKAGSLRAEGVSEANLLCLFKPQSLKHQVVRNIEKKPRSLDICEIFLPLSKRSFTFGPQSNLALMFLMYLPVIVKTLIHMEVKWKFKACHC